MKALIVVCLLGASFASAETPVMPTEVKAAIMASVKASNAPDADDTRGGYHEEGGIFGENTDGKLLIIPAKPGPANKRCGEGAHMSPGDSKDPSLTAHMAVALGEWHVHPSGRTEPTSTVPGCYFIQPPSQADISLAVFPVNIVVGAGDKTVYFYGPQGTTEKIKLKDFQK